jgi:hypothetical protein
LKSIVCAPLRLLECPLTTRIAKEVAGGATGFENTSVARIFECAATAQPPARGCQHAVGTAAECFTSASRLLKGQGGNNTTGGGGGGGGGVVHGRSWRVSTQTVSQLQGYPSGCSVQVTGVQQARVTYNTRADSKVCCGAGSEGTAGTASSLVQLSVAVIGGSGSANITISGPAGVWFGVGLNASLMADKPYAITVEGSEGKVVERRLGSHDGPRPGGVVLAPSVTVLSNVVRDGRRTVVLTRPLKGLTPQHYRCARTQAHRP